MKLTQLLLFAFISTFFIQCTPVPEKPVPATRIMAYYVPERPYDATKVPVEQLTHIIFSFSKVIDGEMKFSRPEDAGPKLEQLVAQKSRNPELKVMIACGGWGADGFSDMVYTAESRSKFIQSAIAFIEKYQLDGIDIDWEYPAIPAAGTGAREEDTQNFTSLMKELREALDTLDRPQILTFASAGWKLYYDNIEMDKVMKYADFMNIMTYDQIGATTRYTGHHTAFGAILEKDVLGTPMMDTINRRRDLAEERAIRWEPQSVQNIVKYCQELGVRPEQIVVGAAFYGKVWGGVPPANNGLYQSNGESHGTKGYAQIRSEFESDPKYVRYWDDIAKAPYLYNASDSVWVTYDDTVSVKLKAKYAIDNKLGGIMFWQLGSDAKDGKGLLNAIYQESIK